MVFLPQKVYRIVSRCIEWWQVRRSFFVWMGALALVAVTLAGFWGLEHYRLEKLAHFRVQYVVCAAIGVALAWWNGSPRAAGISALCFFVNLWIILPGLSGPGRLVAESQPQERSGQLRLLHANVLMSNRRYELVTGFIRETNPDIWFVQEIDSEWLEHLKREFDADYPYSICEPSRNRFGIAAFSRFPFTEARVIRSGPKNDLRGPSLGITVARDGRTLRLFSSHPPPPLDARKARIRNLQIQELLAIADADPSPYVLIGDLNNTRYSPWFQKWVSESRLIAPNGRGLVYTWPTWFAGFAIEIDHCIGTEAARVRVLSHTEHVGSDHYPLVCEVSF